MADASGHVSSWLRLDGTPREAGREREVPEPGSGVDACAVCAPAVDAPVPDTLRALYQRYCEHESRELLTLVSRDAFRGLYRRARTLAQAGDQELVRALDEGGPMELAARFARRHLPLPPYELWVDSYRRDRGPFLERLGMEAAPTREEPVAVSVRPIGDGWYAALCIVRSSDGWSGSIRFHRDESARAWTTANVFRAEDVDEIRSRFRSFDDNTLRAFLRSVLP